MMLHTMYCSCQKQQVVIFVLHSCVCCVSQGVHIQPTAIVHSSQQALQASCFHLFTSCCFVCLCLVSQWAYVLHSSMVSVPIMTHCRVNMLMLAGAHAKAGRQSIATAEAGSSTPNRSSRASKSKASKPQPGASSTNNKSNKAASGGTSANKDGSSVKAADAKSGGSATGEAVYVAHLWWA